MTQPSTTYHHGNLAQAILARAAEIIDAQGIEALTLRGIARDLGVSHGAPNRHYRNKAELLSALATEGWLQARDATLEAADATGSDCAHVRLNAMGRGYLRWALNNRAWFRAICHPDVNRFASDELKAAITEYSATVHDAVVGTQQEGRHPEVSVGVLAIYTNAVPMGAAMLLNDPLLTDFPTDHQSQEQLIDQIIDLVVPRSQQ